MFAHHFNVAEVRSRLANVVDRFGRDHTAVGPNGQSGCQYSVVENGSLTAVCIVGQFFADLGLLGILVQEVPPLSGIAPAQYGACEPSCLMWNNLEKVGITFDDAARDFLRSAQGVQDAGDTWGDALDFASAEYLHLRAREAHQSLGLSFDQPWPEVPRKDDPDFGELVEDDDFL